MSITLPFKAGQKVIEIGGGDQSLFHPNYDKRAIAGVDVVCDLEERWPIEDASVDGVFGKFIGEHVGWRKAPHLFKEMGRVLRAGGVAVMIIPNTLEQCREITRRNRIGIEENALLYGGQEFEDNFHKCAYSPDYVTKLLQDAGFGTIHVNPLPNVITDMVVDATKGTSDVAGLVQSEWYRKLKESMNTQPTALKINLGSFTVMHKGWLNVDVLDLTQYAKANDFSFMQHDVRQGLPFPDKSVEAAITSHMAEHLTRPEFYKFLQDLLRVMKPGAPVRVTVPSAYILAKAYIEGTIREKFSYNEGVKNAMDDAEAFWNMLTAGHLTAHDSHSVRDAMIRAGFSNVEITPPGGTKYEALKLVSDMYPDHSAYVEGFAFPYKMPDRLKIALITPPLLRTPPDRYGGLEQVVYDLAVELGKTNDVTVFAAKGSKVPGCKVFETLEPANTTQVDWSVVENEAYNLYKDKLKGFDIVHDNTWLGFAYLAKREYPKLKVLHTHHGGLSWKSKPTDKPNLIAISDWMVRVYSMQGWNAKRVYNGVDMTKYQMNKPKNGLTPAYEERRNERLLFVGRLDSFKQPHVAIEVAKRLGVGIDLVGGSFVYDTAYLERIKTLCDGEVITLHLDATHEDKIKLMQDNRLLLFPSRMGEPFGLVAVEAMACGMPVIALNDGAIGEVVQDGVQGRVVGDINMGGKPDEEADITALVEAIKDYNIHSPHDCRKRAEFFSRETMAANYLKLYKEIITNKEW